MMQLAFRPVDWMMEALAKSVALNVIVAAAAATEAKIRKRWTANIVAPTKSGFDSIYRIDVLYKRGKSIRSYRTQIRDETIKEDYLTQTHRSRDGATNETRLRGTNRGRLVI